MSRVLHAMSKGKRCTHERGSITLRSVVIEDVNDSPPTARALLKGGADVMEITRRTNDAINQTAAQCPDMLAGAGTGPALDRHQACVDAGARFIVSSDLDAEIVTRYAARG